MRDDFAEQVKRTLAARVGNLCSNPDCQALTSGPQDDPTKVLNVGVAAHISAATTVRLNVEENQLVNVFGEFGICLGGLKSA
jgi:hypothetical protein